MIEQGLERKITVPSILKFALPSMVMMVVMSLYTVVDGMFVSRLVGTDAFSAVNIVYPLLSFVIGFSVLFGVSGVWSASVAAELMAFVLAMFYTIKKKSLYRYLP